MLFDVLYVNKKSNTKNERLILTLYVSYVVYSSKALFCINVVLISILHCYICNYYKTRFFNIRRDDFFLGPGLMNRGCLKRPATDDAMDSVSTSLSKSSTFTFSGVGVRFKKRLEKVLNTGRYMRKRKTKYFLITNV